MSYRFVNPHWFWKRLYFYENVMMWQRLNKSKVYCSYSITWIYLIFFLWIQKKMVATLWFTCAECRIKKDLMHKKISRGTKQIANSSKMAYTFQISKNEHPSDDLCICEGCKILHPVFSLKDCICSTLDSIIMKLSKIWTCKI